MVWGAAALALILAIVTAVFAFNTETTYVKAMLFVTAFLFLALAGLVGYLAYFDMAKVVPNEGGSRHNPIPQNYFLNAKGAKKRIAVLQIITLIIMAKIFLFQDVLMIKQDIFLLVGH
jgi:hypothetical protein